MKSENVYAMVVLAAIAFFILGIHSVHLGYRPDFRWWLGLGQPIDPSP